MPAARLLAILITIFATAVFTGAYAIERLVTVDQARSGALLLRSTEPGRYVEAPMVSSDIQISVAGLVVRTVVTQRFRNPSQHWVEGLYTFPLPEDSAVDTLRMRVGDRFIQGRIEEKQEARRQYEQAKQEGRRAALVEQHRPNVFMNNVANIGPGEIIVTQIEYQQSLAPKDGAFSLRMPLVVAPRYDPNPVVHAVAFDGTGWSVDNQPPLHDPSALEKGEIHNPVTLSIDLDAGFKIAALASPFHQVDITQDTPETATVALQGAVAANRDFELVWQPEVGAAPKAALFRESAGEDHHYLLMLTPPADNAGQPVQPREVIFVQDVSGSMDGESIRQAREGLEMALRRLRQQDRFNIVAFSNEFHVYAEQSVQATPEAIERAIRTVRDLRAGGGTEMYRPLEWALDEKGSDPSLLRQVIFLTDGAVNNEAALFGLIKRDLGRSRLFTVGIGSAPNSYFMTEAAEHGRGAHVYIGDTSEVAAKMQDLFAKIETPALTDITLDLPDGVDGEVYPGRIPDLYVGEPIVVAVKADAATGTAVLRGQSMTGPFEMTIPLDQAAEREGIARLWARKRIGALEAARLSPSIVAAVTEAVVDAKILQTALDYQITSRLTSLIAVDDQVARPSDAPMGTAQIALNLPEGWNPAVFLKETGPADAVPTLDDATDAKLFRIKATVPAADVDGATPETEEEQAVSTSAPAPGAHVPRGSTDWAVMVVIGMMIMLIGVLMIAHGRTQARRHPV